MRGLSKSFEHGFFALKNVSLSVSSGEIVGILGPNGAGKTTLIHSILGLITPTSGSIEIFGKKLDHGNRLELLSRMNFASNYVSLPQTLTPWENLMVYALMYEVENPRERCARMLELFDLYHLRKKISRSLSSGQMMRLTLAKALLNNPEILLLDEPTSGLDPEIARKTRELLKDMASRQGLSVIYTSHNLWEMQEVADRVIFLKAGEILMQGPSSELLGKYNVENLEELFFKALKTAG